MFKPWKIQVLGRKTLSLMVNGSLHDNKLNIVYEASKGLQSRPCFLLKIDFDKKPFLRLKIT